MQNPARLRDDGAAGGPGEDLDLARRVHHDLLQRRVALLLAQRDHLCTRRQLANRGMVRCRGTHAPQGVGR